MSKKSRKRNKKILAVLGALGGAALMARNKRNASIEANEAKESGFDIPAVTSTPKKKPSTPVTTKTTIMDSMPARQKFNEKSNRIKKNTNKVYTIQDAKKGIPAKVGNTSSIFQGEDGYLRQGVDATPMTGGRFGTYKAAKEMERGMLPPQLRAPKISAPRTYNEISAFAAKDGGRAKLKSGGKVKGCGKALRGFGRAMKKGKK